MSELKEYRSGTAFPGVIGRTFDVSSPAWPEPLRAREGAPNTSLVYITVAVLAPMLPLLLLFMSVKEILEKLIGILH